MHTCTFACRPRLSPSLPSQHRDRFVVCMVCHGLHLKCLGTYFSPQQLQIQARDRWREVFERFLLFMLRSFRTMCLEFGEYFVHMAFKVSSLSVSRRLRPVLY